MTRLEIQLDIEDDEKAKQVANVLRDIWEQHDGEGHFSVFPPEPPKQQEDAL